MEVRMEKECCKCHQIKDESEFEKRNDVNYCHKCTSINNRRRKIKKNTPEENFQFLYKLYMRGETVEDCCLYFETSNNIIIEALNLFGIFPDQTDKLFCSKCNQMKSFDEFDQSKNRRGFKPWCKTCNKEYNDTYYEDNSDYIKQKTLNYYYENYDIEVERRIKYHYDHRDEILENKRIMRQNEEFKQNKAIYDASYYEIYKEEIKENIYQWKINNPAKVREIQEFYRIAKLQATPKWIDREEILKYYIEARRLTEETGILYSVDHIIPLQGENVCGLHVPWNLQVITQSENCRKNNKVLVEM